MCRWNDISNVLKFEAMCVTVVLRTCILLEYTRWKSWYDTDYMGTPVTSVSLRRLTVSVAIGCTSDMHSGFGTSDEEGVSGCE